MKDRLTDGIKHIKEIQLTEHERSVMFSRISGYMESTASKPIPASWTVRSTFIVQCSCASTARGTRGVGDW